MNQETFELGFFDPLDPYEKIIYKKKFSTSEMKDINWDEDGHIWFFIDGKEVSGKGDLVEIERIFKNQQK